MRPDLLVITIPPLPDYDITRPETITPFAPAVTVLSDLVIDSVNSFVVRATPGFATLSGALIDSTRFGMPAPRPVSEAELVAGHTLGMRNLSLIINRNEVLPT